MLSVVVDCNRPSTVWYDSCLLGRVQQLCCVAPPGHKTRYELELWCRSGMKRDGNCSSYQLIKQSKTLH
jgi:hypothetical protein